MISSALKRATTRKAAPASSSSPTKKTTPSSIAKKKRSIKVAKKNPPPVDLFIQDVMISEFFGGGTHEECIKHVNHRRAKKAAKRGVAIGVEGPVRHNDGAIYRDEEEEFEMRHLISTREDENEDDGGGWVTTDDSGSDGGPVLGFENDFRPIASPKIKRRKSRPAPLTLAPLSPSFQRPSNSPHSPSARPRSPRRSSRVHKSSLGKLFKFVRNQKGKEHPE